jgi:hypothetical protein
LRLYEIGVVRERFSFLSFPSLFFFFFFSSLLFIPFYFSRKKGSVKGSEGRMDFQPRNDNKNGRDKI